MSNLHEDHRRILRGLLLVVAATAAANESAIRQVFQKKFPKMTVESVTRLRSPGFSRS